MRILDGSELAGYVKERQAKQVRALRQAHEVFPNLAIVVASDNPVIATYVRLKKNYGEDILIAVTVHTVPQAEVSALIDTLNADPSVHGIIVQLPLTNPEETDAIVGRIAPEKDVDGLGSVGTVARASGAGSGDSTGSAAGGNRHPYVSATATAIDWLLAGYNVSLSGKKIAIVGNGRLVGAPLMRLWSQAGLDVSVYDDTMHDLAARLRQADIIVTATGVPGLITSDMIAPGKVVVDAGTASENGRIVGDVAPEVRERQDLTLTPVRGGVGPLTVAALFDNVITAAQKSIEHVS